MKCLVSVFISLFLCSSLAFSEETKTVQDEGLKAYQKEKRQKAIQHIKRKYEKLDEIKNEYNDLKEYIDNFKVEEFNTDELFISIVDGDWTETSDLTHC